MKRIGLYLLLAVAAWAVWASVIFVDETEFAIVTQFGRPVATIDEAGLHGKLPYQSVIRVDRRLQIYNPRPAEFLAAEKKNVNLDVFVCWRVARPEASAADGAAAHSGPLRFLETVNDLPGAEARLHDIVWSELAAEIGRTPLTVEAGSPAPDAAPGHDAAAAVRVAVHRPQEALVAVDSQGQRLEQLLRDVTQRAAERAQRECGVEIVDVRLKRISMPSQVRESVFGRMRAERGRIARRYRAEGEQKATEIRAAADKDRQIKLAEAYEGEQKIRGAAEATAISVYGQAHQQDPAFYELLRTLDAYKKILDEKTTILLSGDSELLKYLTRGAGQTPGPPAKPQAAAPTATQSPSPPGRGPG